MFLKTKVTFSVNTSGEGSTTADRILLSNILKETKLNNHK